LLVCAREEKWLLLARLPRLAELAATAVYLASDGAGAMSGAMVNLTCGAIID
jgi:3-oxoacyl-[acyl-carrier protein] reductase